jgi:two-component system sensor histidine kinase PilS (NtrC family)
MVSVALRETGRLSRVVDDFLRFARPRDPEPKPFSPGELVCHVVDLCAAEAEAKNIELTCRSGGEGEAYADSEQVTQVLINLVRNALQATPEGGQVVLSAGEAPGPEPGGSAGRIRFEVADNGTGVPGELGNSIYDPYFTGREGGTGLGLSISAQLVRQNGGVLTHSSNPAGGATFRFDLPRARGGSHE